MKNTTPMHIVMKLHKFDDENLKLKAAEVLKNYIQRNKDKNDKSSFQKQHNPESSRATTLLKPEF